MTSGDLATQVEALDSALTGLRRAVAPDQVWHAGDDEVLTACRHLSALRARTEAAYLSLVAEVDRRRAASSTPTGTGGGSAFGSTTEGLLRTAALVSAGQARRDVAAAHALHGSTTDRGTSTPAVLPGLAEQLGAGTITREHVDVAVRCLDRIPRHLTGAAAGEGGSPVTTEQLGTTVHDVVVTSVSEVAGTGTARDLDRACRVVLGTLDPDGGDRFDPAAYERRYLDLSTDSTGMLLGRFQLDQAAGLALRAAIDAHSAPTPSEDGVRDPRSARQRRADALVGVAETARAVAAPVRGEPARVVVHVTPDLLAAAGQGGGIAGPPDLSRGTARVGGGAAGGPPSWSDGAAWAEGGAGAGRPTWPGGAAWAERGETVARPTARRVACDAVLQRVVVGPSAGPLELGREVRLASRTQRRALAARDRGCIVPGCGARPDACDAHHVQHWADGGPTDLLNLVLLCGTHHTAVHAGSWSVVMCDDGIPEVVPPRWVDPDRRPRRLWHHLVDGAAARARNGGATQGAPTVAARPTPRGRPVHDGLGGLAVVLTLRHPAPVPTDLDMPTDGHGATDQDRSTDRGQDRDGAQAPRSAHGPTEQNLLQLLDTG